jgi:hypothetical protein
MPLLSGAAWPARGRRGSSSGRSALRLWGFRHGPAATSTTPDENAHFVPAAIGMFGHTYNPNYFINPPAYTYLLHAAFALRLRRARGVSGGVRQGPGDVFASPARSSRRARAGAVGLLAWAGGACSTAASAWSPPRCSAVAFLPVHYAHLALNDVPTLAPVCLALVGVAGVYAAAGSATTRSRGGLGLACATKYTAGSCCCRCAAPRSAGQRTGPRLAASCSRACSRSPSS